MNRSLRERVIRFGQSNGLVGILSTNREFANAALPHVVIVNAGIMHRVGPNRLYVDLARSMTRGGYSVLRIDLAGLGDSEGVKGTKSLAESAIADITAALDHLNATRSATSFVLAGLCSGANYSILAAFKDPRIVGALMIDPSVARTRRSMAIHVVRRLRNLPTLRALATFTHPIYRRTIGGMRSLAVARAADGQIRQRADAAMTSAVSIETVRHSIERIVDRGVHLMIVFTGGVNHVYNYRDQLYDLLPGLDFRDQLKLLYMADTDHTVSDQEGRRRLLLDVESWLYAAFGSPVSGVVLAGVGSQP